MIEDDPAIGRALSRALTEAGDSVRVATTAVEAMGLFAAQAPDVVLLDLGLPDLDGTDVLAMVRASSAIPVIVTTARDDEAEIVRVLDAGADDYLVKPFAAAQVRARIRAVLRRGAAGGDETPAEVVVGGLRIDPRARVAVIDGTELELTRKEFDLLLALASRAGEVVTKRQLLAEVWQLPWGGADRTVDVHVSWLRRKLGESAAEPRYLRSVRGVGLKIVDPGA